MQAGAQAAQKVGQLVAQHVIPNPHSDLVDLLDLEGPSGNPAPSPHQSTNLETLSVTQLRQLARETPGLSIQGRKISRANRDQLLRELQRAGGQKNPLASP